MIPGNAKQIIDELLQHAQTLPSIAQQAQVSERMIRNVINGHKASRRTEYNLICVYLQQKLNIRPQQ